MARYSAGGKQQILQYAPGGKNRQAYWLVVFCLATIHLCLLIPFAIFLICVSSLTAVYELDWAQLTWLQRFTFGPWWMQLPELLSATAGLITWKCILDTWRDRPKRRRLFAVIAIQSFVTVFYITTGPYLLKLGWLPLHDFGSGRVVSDDISQKLVMQGLVAFPMLAFLKRN